MTFFRLWTKFFHRRNFPFLILFGDYTQDFIGIITNISSEKLWKCTIARQQKLWYDRRILVGLLYSTTIDPAC